MAIQMVSNATQLTQVDKINAQPKKVEPQVQEQPKIEGDKNEVKIKKGILPTLKGLGAGLAGGLATAGVLGAGGFLACAHFISGPGALVAIFPGIAGIVGTVGAGVAGAVAANMTDSKAKAAAIGAATGAVAGAVAGGVTLGGNFIGIAGGAIVGAAGGLGGAIAGSMVAKKE